MAEEGSKHLNISPILMLMIMEDYEAMGGELPNNPAYLQQYFENKQKLIHGLQTNHSRTTR